MLLKSQQQQIIQSVSISFLLSTITHLKYQDQNIGLNTKKYETLTKEDFNFLVGWTCFKYNTSAQKTATILNAYTKDELKVIQQYHDQIKNYKFYLEIDLKNMNTKQDINPNKLFNQNELSLVGLLWFQIKKTKTRIEKKQKQNANLFLDFLIQNYNQDLAQMKQIANKENK